MGKFRASMVICYIFLFLTGCGDQENRESSKVSEERQKVEQAEGMPQKEIETKEVEGLSWEGEWIFLSDDNLGQLLIEQVDENTIKYHLTGSRNNPVNGGSYGNALEGMGYINGDQLEFTNDLNDDCGGVMKKNNNIITVALVDGACHTPQVVLDGYYKKSDSFQTQPLLIVEEGVFKIYGISLGAAPSQVKGLIGNPEYEGPDDDGFDEWIQRFTKNVQYTTYFDNAVTSIHLDAPLSELKGSISRYLDGELYTTEEGAEYFYLPDTSQLLIYSVNLDNHTMASLFVTYADGNFYSGVENGWIAKKGE